MFANLAKLAEIISEKDFDIAYREIVVVLQQDT